jgi:hypothetical protein
LYYTASKEIVDTEITMRSDGVLITIGITTTTTTAAVGATAKTTVELLLSMRVSEEEKDKVTSLFD